MVKVGIVGASGYTGGELLRLLLRILMRKLHIWLHARTRGVPLRDVSTAVLPDCDLEFRPLDIEAMVDECDVIFTAVPHGAAMEWPAVVAAGKRLIDIGTDFRFRNAGIYEAWYGIEQNGPDLTASAAYGLPELFREQIAGSQIVGNPGCYPTSVLLGLAPALRAGIVDRNVVSISSPCPALPGRERHRAPCSTCLRQPRICKFTA